MFGYQDTGYRIFIYPQLKVFPVDTMSMLSDREAHAFRQSETFTTLRELFQRALQDVDPDAIRKNHTALKLFERCRIPYYFDEKWDRYCGYYLRHNDNPPDGCKVTG